jgi:hypothetical protein
LNAKPRRPGAASRNPNFTAKDSKSTKKRRLRFFFSKLRVLREEKFSETRIPWGEKNFAKNEEFFEIALQRKNAGMDSRAALTVW